ncbi:CPBP family intramembrane metalloprotease [Bacillus sp. AFS018417]|uniref:CPBP family intramembrane glutamic endopeptidase n=2 Tax=Bacillaceae TaxID=186817 RepID=UPI000BF6211E|nr:MULTISPECIES: CPBP family intramembrane glutamic endopeptidase [unclassified Bacillus (in: firmicutes)]MCP1123145.1 CPBP family intramembrane metalloprotease [Bacillus sp. 3103sda1]PEZ05760.1 CPBP family intramembrane metalloprotease [Bacillus sp. AFS018417]
MDIRKTSIEDMSLKEIRLNLYITQAIIICIGILLAYILFPSMDAFLALWKWDFSSIFLIGGGVACVIVLFDYIAMHFFPESWFDDGGINDRMFQGMSVFRVFAVTLLIGIAEEFLFRGVIQTYFGLIFASVVFAVLHIRYITKPFLFCFVLMISSVFGFVFQWTGNLLITIFAHFLVDFIMGLQLRKQTEDGGDRYGEADNRV